MANKQHRASGIKIIGVRKPRIIDTSPSPVKLIDPTTLAEALGAKRLCPPCGSYMHARAYGQPNAHLPCNDDSCGCRCKDPQTQMAEQFLCVIGWAAGQNPMIINGRVSADMGLPLPNPPLSRAELEIVLFEAKKAMHKVLRKRSRKKLSQ